MLQTDLSLSAETGVTPQKAMDELELNTTCDTAPASTDEEEEEDGFDVAMPLPTLRASQTSQRTKSDRRSKSDLKVASRTRDVRYILHKMRERRADVQLQIWAVDALQVCQDEDIEDETVSEEIIKNIIRGLKRHPYSAELQHKAIICMCHLAKSSNKVKESLVEFPEGMEVLFSALRNAQEDDKEGREQHEKEEIRKQRAMELFVAVFSLFAVGFDQFDHSQLVDEGAINAIVQILHQLEGDTATHSDESVFEWGTLALGELSWLCEDMSVPQVFPNLSEMIALVVTAMNRYPYNSIIQNSAGEILRHIMKNDEDSIRVVIDAGGAAALVVALNNHLDQEDVLVEGCLTLTHFLPFADIRDQCFTTVLATMAQHTTNVDVQLGGCAFLADAAEYTSNTFRFLFDSTQAVPLLMTAMELNPDNPRLQEHACRALRTIGPWLKRRSEGKKVKILGMVVKAIRKYPNEYWLQLYGCLAIEGMVLSWGNEATVYMVKVGGIRVIQGIMEKFIDDAEMLWPGLATVARLDLVGNKFARDAVMKEKCVRGMMDAIKRHGGHEKVQKFGDMVIDALAQANRDSSKDVDIERSGDCCIRCLKLSLERESAERWQGCTCST